MNKGKETTNNWWAVSFAVVFIVLIWLVTPILLKQYIPDIAQRGLFGDSFGTINSLFSGLAFAGVIIAILLQRQELQLQREELKLTREELSRSAKAQEDSGMSLGEQVQVMKVTAELNGLAALIQSQTEQINYLASADTHDNNTVTQLRNMNSKRDNTIKQLELLMHAVLTASEV